MKPASVNPIERLFTDALAQPVDERIDWLRNACGGDGPLLARVEALLASHEQAGDFLQDVASDWVDADVDELRQLLGLPAASASLDTSPSSLSGTDRIDPNGTPLEDRTRPELQQLAQLQDGLFLFEPSTDPNSLGRLGDWEILERIGRGGMGVVYKARDARLERLVAIKIMDPLSAADDVAKQRFLREARAAASVNHENVVVIHAVQEANGVPYLVMQYVDGPSLHDLLKAGPLKLQEVMEIGVQTALGLAAAHRRGLIHRDVKPANILLDRESQQVKLTDFGLACAADDGRLTKSGKVTGTPHYMSPEQAQDLTVDARSDLFSLGCVLYAMCTGRSPFETSSTMASLRAVCDVSHRPLSELTRDCPSWLVSLVDRLLEKDPQRRPSNAQEVADALRQQGLAPSSENAPSSKATTTETAAPAEGRGGGRYLRWGGLLLVAWAAGLLLVNREWWSERESANSRGFPKPSSASDRSEAGTGSSANALSDTTPPLISTAWEWSEPANLGADVNGPGDETQPCLSSDGLTLLFDSNRAGGQGKGDIWMCRRSSVDSPWSLPVNLGPVVNTTSEDGNACLSTDHLRLYFTSTRPGGLGDYDLWMAERSNVEGPWERCANLGPNVNSPYLDGGPSLSQDERILWLHSFRPVPDGSDLWYCQRASRNELFGPLQNAGRVINAANSFGESSCAVSEDGRYLIWTLCTAMQPARFELRAAQRASTNEPFVEVQRLAELGTLGDPTSPCFSADGMTMVFDAIREGGQGGRDLWVVHRVKRPASR